MQKYFITTVLLLLSSYIYSQTVLPYSDTEAYDFYDLTNTSGTFTFEDTGSPKMLYIFMYSFNVFDGAILQVRNKHTKEVIDNLTDDDIVIEKWYENPEDLEIFYDGTPADYFYLELAYRYEDAFTDAIDGYGKLYLYNVNENPLHIKNYQTSELITEASFNPEKYSIVLENMFGQKTSIYNDGIRSDRFLDFRSKQTMNFYSDYDFVFRDFDEQDKVRINSGTMTFENKDFNNTYDNNIWLRYTTGSYKYVRFRSGKLSNDYTNFLEAHNDVTEPILYYTLKSKDVGGNFNNQAGLVFDIKYYDSEAGVGDNNAVLFKSGFNNHLMSIKGNGNVWMKKDLQVDGIVKAPEVLVESLGGADFVFEDNYHLKDLSEVEAFIKANRHLPEIPSAAEMDETGVNLAEMNKLLLMKVEELTLYSIEQEKKIEMLTECRRRETEEMEERMAKMETLLEELSNR